MNDNFSAEDIINMVSKESIVTKQFSEFIDYLGKYGAPEK